MENKKKNGIYVLFAIIGVAVLVGLDQWTKSLAVRHLAGQESITLIPGVFQLQYLENRGAAFGLLQNQIWLFVILTAIFLAAAVWVYIRLPKIKRYMPLHITAVVLVSGALGNLIDRIRQGKIDDDKGHGKVYRGESCLSQKTSNEHAVDCLVKRGREHADRSGYSRNEEKLQRCRPGKSARLSVTITGRTRHLL